MKKIYMSPIAEILECLVEDTVLAASGVTSNNGMDFGGIDEEGDKEAQIRMLFNNFQFDPFPFD